MPKNLFRFEGVPDRPDVESVRFRAGQVRAGDVVELEDSELELAGKYGLQPVEDVGEDEEAVLLTQEPEQQPAIHVPPETGATGATAHKAVPGGTPGTGGGES